MNLVEKVCHELGVEVGEEWLGIDGNYYIIDKKGKLRMVSYFDDLEESVFEYEADISKILVGELKPLWIPKHGTIYYIPDIFVKDLCLVERWENLDIDYMYSKRGLVFETEEEAVAMAKKIIEFIGEER